MKIFLLGMMGTGKSFWAKHLSEKFHLTFYDTDKEVEKNNNQKIVEIFATKGEDFFRDEETKVLKQILEFNNIIVATGGGMPCFNNNMELMNKNGITIWLNENEETILYRLVNDKEERPLIKQLNKESLKIFISKKAQEREMFYKKAKFILNDKEICFENFFKIIASAQKKFYE